MSYEIIVKHFYQDEQNPHLQTIRDEGEYYMRYDLFKALIDSQLDFNIVPVKKVEVKIIQEPTAKPPKRKYKPRQKKAKEAPEKEPKKHKKARKVRSDHPTTDPLDSGILETIHETQPAKMSDIMRMLKLAELIGGRP